MTKVTTIVLLIVLFVSCNRQNDKLQIENDEASSTEKEIVNITSNKIEVIEYDGCEYLIYKEDKDQNSSYGFMAHKGNCSNQIHQCK